MSIQSSATQKSPLMAGTLAVASDSDISYSNLALKVGKNVTLTLGTDALHISDPKVVKNIQCCGLRTTESTPSQEIPYYNILAAEASESTLSIKYAKLLLKEDYSPINLQYILNDEAAKAESWVEQLLELAYGEAQRNKRLRVLINPYGGKGYATDLYAQYAAPMFEAAGCNIDLETTTHAGHAVDLAESMDVDAYDAIVCCSGDGLPYEVLNGLAKKPNASEALTKMAITMLPCGSGNAMAWNLYGTNSVSLAALGIIKGLRTPLDLASISQGDTRTLSFLSQSYGIIAESDLGTDHLRWMGAARFTYGFLVRLMGQMTYPCDVAFKVQMDQKQQIKEHYLAYKNKKPELRPVGGGDQVGKGLPPLKYGTINDEVPSDWEKISTDTVGNFYAGNMAIMSADVNFFPASLPGDGMMDVVMIDGRVGRMKSLSMMTAVENGAFFDIPEVIVRKVTGYRLVPRVREDGYISVDGERIPFSPFQVEIHQGLGTALSKTGHLYEARGPC
ncbi:sphingosine kinase [Talaromyces islandicus]|uniref:Sphingosine kinase n=1 Tax=Talaromyces islandicus TaxID=28573 RepID=A0A0U1LRE1_TALIS|nr:sphingosine kinase [Talaromyces islandicus]